MAKILISYGADPVQSDIDYNCYRYCCGNQSQCDVVAFEDYAYQERWNYQAVRQLLIGCKDTNSPLSILPKDVVKAIGLWIRG